MSAIVVGTATPANVDAPELTGSPHPAATVPRDHALSLHRFVGGVQMLGGITLSSAYALGADTLETPIAAPILIALGVAQLTIGAIWLLRARALRALVTARPGSSAMVALVVATATAILGGSGAETAWVTSAQCWLIVAGAILPARGLLVGTAASTTTTAALWMLVDGSGGGYGADGHYAIAVIGLAKFLAVGLLLGFLTGRAWQLLTRWHVIELHERGLVRQIQERLSAVNRAAAALATRLPSGTDIPELRDLRARLTRGAELPADGAPVALGTLLDDIAMRRSPIGRAGEVLIDADAQTRAHPLDVVAADTLSAVIERQLDNVDRHAPSATEARLEARLEPTGTLTIDVTDDGGGRQPARTGTGTAWSERQLRRLGAELAYFDAPAGTGLLVTAPVGRAPSAPDLPVRQELEEFAFGMVTVLRWSSYVGDSLVAQAEPGIGTRWLLMPLGAVLIELAIQRGVPGIATTRNARQILASLLAIALTAAFTLPAGSPDVLVPASTSVVVLAPLLLARQHVAWVVFEVARAAVVLPLVDRTGGSLVEIAVIYPVAFNLLVFGVRRFIDRAQDLERTLLDAVGRTELATAAVRGLSLHHDAVDVLLRQGGDTDEVRAGVCDLERAVRALDAAAIDSRAPHEIVRSAVAAAVAVPVAADDMAPTSMAGVSIDRLTLVELSALAADERASCAAPGLLGRRRLRAIHVAWHVEHDGLATLRVTAEPTLGAPDPRHARALRQVAGSLGIDVQSTRADLRLSGIGT